MRKYHCKLFLFSFFQLCFSRSVMKVRTAFRTCLSQIVLGRLLFTGNKTLNPCLSVAFAVTVKETDNRENCCSDGWGRLTQGSL